MLEEAISRREKEGYRVAADWYRLFLVEVYIQIMSGNEKLAPLPLLRNMPVILKVMIIAASRISALTECVFKNPHFHPDGHFIGRGHMLLGLFYKAKKKRPPAVEHLTKQSGYYLNLDNPRYSRGSKRHSQNCDNSAFRRRVAATTERRALRRRDMLQLPSYREAGKPATLVYGQPRAVH